MDRLTFTAVKGHMSSVSFLSIRGAVSHTVLLSVSGSVYAAGRALESGQLGLGDTVDRTTVSFRPTQKIGEKL